MTDNERTCEIWADGLTLCKTHNRPPSECIAALEVERDAERTKREEAERERDEKDAIIAAIGHEKDELRAHANAADCRRAAAEHRAQRIVLDIELKQRAESAESRLAIAVEYIEDLEFNEADYEDNRWRRDAIAAMEKERREALAKIQGKE